MDLASHVHCGATISANVTQLDYMRIRALTHQQQTTLSRLLRTALDEYLIRLGESPLIPPYRSAPPTPLSRVSRT